MKLTQDQHEHLRDLSYSLGRPTNETAALVKHGLAIQGRARYGEWVKITKKGIEFMMNSSAGKRRSGGISASEPKATADGTAIAEKGSPSFMPGGLVGASTPPGAEPQKRPSRRAPNGRRETPDANKNEDFLVPVLRSATAAVIKPSTVSRKVKAPLSNTGGAVHAVPRPCASGGSVKSRGTPNAVRTITGSRARYFPIGMYTSINDESKQRVATGNKFYRSYPVGASTQDDQVFS